MSILLLLALLLLGGSVALTVRAVLLPRLKTSDSLRGIEQYGFQAAAPIHTAKEAKPAFGDLASQIGGLLSQRLKGFRPEELRKELIAAGLYRVSPAALLGYSVIGGVLLGGLGLLTASSLPVFLAVPMVAVTFAVGWRAPLIILHRRAAERLQEIELELPNLIDLLVVTVGAGMGLGASLQLASTKLEGPLVDELKLTLQEQRMGRSLQEALMSMLGRVDTPGMRSFVRSVVQGETLGVSIGQIMRNLADEMRKRRRYSAQERAQKAPVKMLVPLVFLILPAFILTIIGPPVLAIIEDFGS